MKLVNKRLAALLGALLFGVLLAVEPALAAYELNMTPGVTPISKEIYNLHMLILWICVVIGALVFGAIIYSVIKFRRSKGAVASQFHHSTTVENHLDDHSDGDPHRHGHSGHHRAGGYGGHQ